jgi:16S rRNA (uracil1498-N3)-methyltransferase
VRRRFFVEQFEDGRAFMEGEVAHHLGRVLRAQTGQLYELSDGQQVWLGKIEKVARDRVEFSLVEKLPALQPSLNVTLLLSVVKFDAFEWAIEKATELGVSSIVPLAAARSDKALLTAAVKRAARWKKILLEASQQSRRLRVPALEAVLKPQIAFSSHKDGLRVTLSERADAPPIQRVLQAQQAARAVLAIGPEGGWTEEELKMALTAGFTEASLGSLILRTETAVTVALASLNYEFGGG